MADVERKAREQEEQRELEVMVNVGLYRDAVVQKAGEQQVEETSKLMLAPPQDRTKRKTQAVLLSGLIKRHAPGLADEPAAKKTCVETSSALSASKLTSIPPTASKLSALVDYGDESDSD